MADLPDFRDWATFVKVRRDVEEMPERRAIEAQKLSAEFSKIIITNLQFINAGALLATPSISANLLGLTGLTKEDKLTLIGLPMGLFTGGLVLATLAAFFTYRNYEAIANHWNAERLWRESDLGRLSPSLVQRAWSDELKQFTSEKRKSDFRTKMYFWFGLMSGWTSVGCFVSACSLLAWSAR
ncbi:hypothetical protein MMSR116_05845 [Methylobacterium mesophilicum SR1.6/6]|uniref:Uncharacterized protein n=1 Tax=Methylobacterium mesophilicum SR1.6/6 TaxID=908290 RepID=A0A6B9FI82_9HYPH|nr:hypothetical protein [Methylobacterium mesophilicum]QGY01476.1 hypothetical protein MMSR116_05845 [Methylobacterium mesophilicum SR1.6/6]